MEISKKERRVEDDDRRGEDELVLPDLPQEVITEILLRLPAKSIGRFRCVSKLFLSVLSDPRFARSQLDLALRNDAFRYRSQRLILSSYNLYWVEYESIGEENGDLVAVEMDYPLKDKPNAFSEMMNGYAKGRFFYCDIDTNPDDDEDEDDEYPAMVKFESQNYLYQRNWVDIVGSCNGLVCISPSESTIFLLNPTTRESKRVPNPPEILASRSDEDALEAYGFGFDATSDDYKVVKLSSGNGANANVYSLRTDSWKSIGHLPYKFCDGFYTSGVLLNSAVHWVVSCQDHKPLVAAFDLSKEKFWDMPLPDEANDCLHRFREFVVGSLNGCLCVVNSCHELHDDIWIMQEYGVAKSWTRLRIGVVYRFMKPLCFAKSGEVVLELDGNLVLYNFENGTSRELAVQGVQLSDGFEANTYVESLISPNLYGGD